MKRGGARAESVLRVISLAIAGSLAGRSGPDLGANRGGRVASSRKTLWNASPRARKQSKFHHTARRSELDVPSAPAREEGAIYDEPEDEGALEMCGMVLAFHRERTPPLTS